MKARLQSEPVQQAILFALCLVVLLLTLYPSIYTFDSAEFAIGAASLGIVHAPGYPLYLVLAHIFTGLPVGDVGLRVNLFSAVCLALTAPILWTALVRLTQRPLPAWVSAISFIFLAPIWHNGTIAEIYSAQLLTLALCLWSLTRLRESRRDRAALICGLCFGLALAMHPSSALVTPAMAASFLALRVRALTCFGAAGLALLILAGAYLYFPVRQPTQPLIQYAGIYDDSGVFQAVDLSTVDGLLWMMTGQQFEALFYTRGPLPTGEQIAFVVTLFWTTTYGVGMLLALFGLWLMRSRRVLLSCWLCAFVPYTLFYATYGATDRDMMFGPAFLLLTVPVAFALAGLHDRLPVLWRPLLAGLAIAVIALNLPAIAARNRTDVRGGAEARLLALPDEAIAFGLWGDIIPLQYLHLIEHMRPDVTLENLFFFRTPEAIIAFIDRQADADARPLVFMSNRAPVGLDSSAYRISPFRVDGETLGYVFTPAG